MAAGVLLTINVSWCNTALTQLDGMMQEQQLPPDEAQLNTARVAEQVRQPLLDLAERTMSVLCFICHYMLFTLSHCTPDSNAPHMYF